MEVVDAGKTFDSPHTVPVPCGSAVTGQFNCFVSVRGKIRFESNVMMNI